MPAPRHEIEIFRGRFPRFLSTVIEPAIHHHPTTIDIAAWQTPHPVPFAEAARAEYRPVSPGWRWGPPWSTCWFRLRGFAPAGADGLPLDLRFSTRTECTVWIDGHPRRGLDTNRDSLELSPRPAPGSPVEIFIEAACNHPFGVSTFDWDTSDTHDRWRSAEPGHLLLGDLAPRNENVRRLAAVYRFAAKLLDELDPRSPEAGALSAALVTATAAIDDRAVARTADHARGFLERALDSGSVLPALGLAVAHAHIDTAWLWPLAETRRKVLRSWTNALEVLDRHPRATFICSQAQQYAWLEDDAPEVFRRLADRVDDGRFQPMGGMWVEPDANVPSAESLLRQILHADRYWRSRFGDRRGAQHTLYLPDTFGFPASLPDLMHAAGLDLFITNKMSWNQGTPYAHTNSRWRGLGGCEVLAHNTPNHDYNCTNTPRELRRITTNLRGHPDPCAHPQPFLHPFGFGDGGGGPTLEQAEAIDLAGNHPAFAPLRHATLDEFRRLLRELDASLPGGLPVHEGEHYLELHRGTLTTHAWLKRANRELEQALRLAEVLAFASPTRSEKGPIHTERLDHAWKLLLLQQFHDILPGSSIMRVYDDCRAHLAEIRAIVEMVMAESLPAWSSPPPPPPSGTGVPPITPSPPHLAILNPASAPQSTVLEHAGELHLVSTPTLSLSPFVPYAGGNSASPVSPGPLHLNPSTGELSNGIVSARIDRSGRVASLRLTNAPELAESPLNRLALYRDIPMNWDAWDLDAYTEDELLWTNDTPAESWIVRTNHPLRAEIEVSRPIGDGSAITQVFRLDAGSPRLDILTSYRWNERHRLLRAEMPTAIRAPFATFDIQCGFIHRPTTRDTLAERMMFEVCAHRWMDLSEPGKGLALLNNGRYGHACRGGVMSLSLLRAPRHPDPTAGRDEGTVTYSLMPHAGDWRTAGVDLEADRLNNPLRSVPVACDAPWSPVTISQAPGQRLDIAALKATHDDPTRLVLRLIETRGIAGRARVKWNLPVARVARADALERPIDAPCAHGGDTTTLEIPPHGIVTLIADRA